MPGVRTVFSVPSDAEAYNASDAVFRRFVNAQAGLDLKDYHELHRWSVENVEAFWELVWEYGGVIGSYEPGKLFDASFPMDKPNPHLIRATMNLAENFLLSHTFARSKHLAVTSVMEGDPSLEFGTAEYLDSTFLRSLTFAQLYDEVHQISKVLKSMGVGHGDRVAAFAPSNAEAVVMVLATAAIGAVWSSCPAEFGVRATLERLTQIEPKVLLTADYFRYDRKTLEVYPKLLEILEQLPTVKNVIVVGQLHRDRQPRGSLPKDASRTWQSWPDVVAEGKRLVGSARHIDFHPCSAMDPVYVLYSSGTTGKPKAIVHSVGGMVLSSKMSNLIHQGYKPGDSLLQFSTLGWMMANYAMSTLGAGVNVVMYDGSPLKPQSILFQLVEKYRITVLGVSPRYIQTLDTSNYRPKDHHDLSSLRMIGTAGSVLKAELYDWIRDNIGEKVFINNGTGGTDICNLFVGPVPSLPIHHAEITAAGLGMDLKAWDEDGKSLVDEQGDMVILRPFPNMPIGFWGDDTGERYKAAYYEAFPTPVWTQGDWIEINSVTKGIVVVGRSDGVLNPAGVRFGSSELYSVVEEMKHLVEDCIAVGKKILGGDEEVVLFVTPKDKGPLTPATIQELRSSIAKNLSPRHVPAKIIKCDKIPYTGNGKKLEVATKKLVNGVPFDKINLSSAEDAESLRFFVNHPELVAPSQKAKL